MNNEYQSSTCIVDNLYAFLGWVVSYSDYGKEVAVDTMLKKFKLLEKIDESMAFESKEEYDEYNELIKKINAEEFNDEGVIKLTQGEIKRCKELKNEFTLRFKRAKQFTVEQIAEYKAKKILKKDYINGLDEPMQPVKLIDHESKRVVCVFYSPEYAAKALVANKKKIKEAVEKSNFYKGYIWMSCEVDLYEKYNENLVKK